MDFDPSKAPLTDGSASRSEMQRPAALLGPRLPGRGGAAEFPRNGYIGFAFSCGRAGAGENHDSISTEIRKNRGCARRYHERCRFGWMRHASGGAAATSARRTAAGPNAVFDDGSAAADDAAEHDVEHHDEHK